MLIRSLNKNGNAPWIFTLLNESVFRFALKLEEHLSSISLFFYDANGIILKTYQDMFIDQTGVA